MRTPRVVQLLSIFVISLGLEACGGMPPTTLTGNWLLAGSRVPAAYPIVSTSLFIQGNAVTGELVIYTQCTKGIFTATSTSSVAIKGTIGNDGTFQASGTVSGIATSNTLSVSLSGNSPTLASPSVWTGAYSVTGGVCGVDQTANFTATAIAPMTGTYIGSPADPGTVPQPFGANAVVSLQITQGAPTLVTRSTDDGGVSTFLIPLTANFTIANSPCSISLSTTGASIPSTVHGDSFELSFLLPGSGGGGIISGTLSEPTANSFSANLNSLSNAIGCPGAANYTFTRQ